MNAGTAASAGTAAEKPVVDCDLKSDVPGQPGQKSRHSASAQVSLNLSKREPSAHGRGRVNKGSAPGLKLRASLLSLTRTQ